MTKTAYFHGSRFLVCCLLGLLIAVPARAADERQGNALHAALRDQLDGTPAQSIGLNWPTVPASRLEQILTEIYSAHGMRPLWFTADGPGGNARILFDTLANAGSHGLDPGDYGVELIGRIWPGIDAESQAIIDIALTIGLVSYANDLHEGRIAPREEDPKLFAHARDSELNASSIVPLALASPDLGRLLENLAPGNIHYDQLRRKLPEYRVIAAGGGWRAIAAGPTLHPGDTDPRVIALRERLQITGELDQAAAPGAAEYFDEALEAAVKLFQARHGLSRDGVVGANTVAAMNVPVERRIQQIEINMERWRWMTHDLGDDYIFVDIAGFTLEGVRNDRISIEMPVIVGKHYHETPVFSDRIRYLEFNPFWNITTSIARNEMLPKLRENPGYLDEHHIRLFSDWGPDSLPLDPRTIDWSGVSRGQMGAYKLRQEPGPWNALGTVKFMFPNQHNVYLHDTPNHDLFSRAERAFSHGCIRVSDPWGLAIYLLGGDNAGWNRPRIEKIIESRERTIARLDQPVPVYLAYRTAWVDQHGTLRFNKDVYGRDARLETALYGHN